MKQAAIRALFTRAEIRAAAKLLAQCQPGEFSRRVVEEIVQPAMPRISKMTDHDARYLGYVLEIWLDQRQ